MIVVLDTNVLVSGIFFGGVPRSILDAWADGKFDLLLSPAIYEEYERTCERLAQAHPHLTYHRVLLDLTRFATFLPNAIAEHPITEDPDDDKFLLCARDGHSGLVVSGDRHLLAASGWSGVQVLNPRTFLEHLSSTRS